MGRTACTEPQCLYKGALYLTFTLFPGELSLWDMQHTILLLLLPRFRMCGALRPLHVFFRRMVLKQIQGQLLILKCCGI